MRELTLEEIEVVIGGNPIVIGSTTAANPIVIGSTTAANPIVIG